jgi:hypothetical protein
MSILDNLIQPWSLVVFGVAGFLFFLAIGKLSKKP